MNSRSKGKEGEREAARILTELFNIPVRRGQQFRGGPDSPDVIGLEGLHVEVKRRERLNLDVALRQSAEETAPGNVPMVLHRGNRTLWKVSIYAEDLPRFVETTAGLLERGKEFLKQQKQLIKEK